MLKLKLKKEDLIEIIHWGNPKYVEIACERILKRNPDRMIYWDMVQCCVGSSRLDEYRELASKKLFQNPSNYELEHIVCHGPEKCVAIAYNRLMKRKYDSTTLRQIIFHAPEIYKIKALKRLLKEYPVQTGYRELTINRLLHKYKLN